MMKKSIKWKGRTIIIILFLSLSIFFNFQSSPILTTQAASGTFTEDFITTTYMDGTNTNVTGWGTGYVENSKKKPTIVGSISSTLIGNTLDVFVDGNFAYVTNENDGLEIVNITDPTNPQIISSSSTMGMPYGVCANGDYVYIADYTGDSVHHNNFIILNVTNPLYPEQLGNCSTYFAEDHAANDVVVDGDKAFVANMGGGIRVIDISNPKTPLVVGSKETNGIAYNLVLEGDLLFVADGSNGLVILNITTPTIPTLIATYSTGLSSVVNVLVEGDYAYLIDSNNGLIVVNITSPANPLFAGSLSKSNIYDAYISGDYIYLADVITGLDIVNITNPRFPTLVDSVSIPGNTYSIDIDGCFAYLACLSEGFKVVKIIDLTTPSLIGSYDTPGTSWGVYVSGDCSFVADGYSGLKVFNISNPSSPTLIGSYDTPGAAVGVFISGDYAYIADHNRGLLILNISDPSSPTYLGSYDTPNYSFEIAVSGDYAYVADGTSGLQIINISDPTSPTYVSSYNTPSSAYGIFISGDYVYVANWYEGLLIFDISDPSTPILAGFYNETIDRVDCVSVAGNYAYIGDRYNGLKVLDISNPKNPILISTFDTPGTAIDIFLSGNYVFIADYGRGLQVIDISDPFNPTFAGSYDPPINQFMRLFISGDYAYIGGDTYGFKIIEVRISRIRQFVSLCVAQSNTVFSASSAIIVSATLVSSGNTPASASITYYLSADGGSNWESITPGIEHVFSNIGNQLIWQAVLTTSHVLVTPVIYNLSINFNTNLVAPSLNTPIDSYIIDDYTPTFTWFGINGESNYLFQLDTSTSFTTPLLNITLPSSSTSFTPGTPLAVDTYYWRVAGIDSEGDLGGFSSYRTLYLIQDTNAPAINQPSDTSYEQGTTGNTITWTPTDSNPYWYNITLNGFLSSHDDPWLGGNIVMNIDGLALGSYTVVCSVYDLEDLMISDTVNIEVVLSAPPTIDDVADFAYEEGSTSNSITWHPSDANPDYYSITRDGLVIDDGPWLGGDISINIDGLAYSVYTYVCFVNDTEGQSASDSVVITVTDSVSPLINSPSEIIYYEGDTGNNIIWVATDNNPATYIVYKDGASYETDTWTSGSSIIILIDGLSAGQYNFTIVVVDQAGNSAKDTVIVAVTAIAPEFSQSVFLAIASITVVFVLYYIKRRTNKKS